MQERLGAKAIIPTGFNPKSRDEVRKNKDKDKDCLNQRDGEIKFIRN